VKPLIHTRVVVVPLGGTPACFSVVIAGLVGWVRHDGRLAGEQRGHGFPIATVHRTVRAKRSAGHVRHHRRTPGLPQPGLAFGVRGGAITMVVSWTTRHSHRHDSLFVTHAIHFRYSTTTWPCAGALYMV